MLTQVDDYPAHISDAIEALLKYGKQAGREQLNPIAYSPRTVDKRPGLSRSMAGHIFQRDQFTCRYCGGLTILTSIMELVATVYPDIFPFHPNWKGGLTHPAIISRSAVVDHVEPGALGGDWHAEQNLVTACWPCNARKGDLTLAQLGWSVREISEIGWDGLTRFYPALWTAAGRPKPRMHLDWMRSVGVHVDNL